MEERITGRSALLARSVEVFQAVGAASIHVFGSLARGNDDPLSDLDLWITIPDDLLATVVLQRDEAFASIAPVLIKHEALENRPLRGSYSLIIHETNTGLYQTDYYLAPRSMSVILPEARLLAGDDTLPRGTWVLDRSETTPTSHTERVDFLTCMGFIGVKMALRGNEDFLRFLIGSYNAFREQNQLELPPIPDGAPLEQVQAVLTGLVNVADTGQRKAIETIQVRYVSPTMKVQSSNSE